MKKNLGFSCILLLSLFISTRSSAQSTIIIDNPESKAIPVKITNQANLPSAQTKTPFTETHLLANGSIVIIKGPATSDSTRVVEWVVGNGTSSTAITIKLNRNGKDILYRIYIPSTNIVSIPAPPGNTNPSSVNTYSGSVNIVLKNGETATFTIDGSGNQTLLVSGYTLR